MRGSPTSARAARTFSRAAPSVIPHFQLSQCAQDFTPHSAQPPRRSSSAIKDRNRAFAAFKWPAKVVISSTSAGVETAEKSLSMGHSMSLLFYTVPYQRQRKTQGIQERPNELV